MTAGEVMAAWERAKGSEAGQAALQAEVPDLTREMARVVVPLLRPGLNALQESTEAGDDAA